MNRIELRLRALDVAIGELGTRETAPNRGPRIGQYQQAAGLTPGQPWCMAFVVFCYQMAAESLGHVSPLPAIGKVARFWRKCDQLWLSGRPEVGAIYCHLVDPKDPESKGHCGIVARIGEGGSFFGIEGNSNTAGSREGDGVVMNQRRLAYVNLGFVDVGREGPSQQGPLVS